MSLSRDDVLQLQEVIERRLAQETREFLAKAARPHQELDEVTKIVTAPDGWRPPADAHPVFAMAGTAAAEASHRILSRFKAILGLFETRPTIPARVVLPLVPLDTSSFFWARCSALLTIGSTITPARLSEQISALVNDRIGEASDSLATKLTELTDRVDAMESRDDEALDALLSKYRSDRASS